MNIIKNKYLLYILISENWVMSDSCLKSVDRLSTVCRQFFSVKRLPTLFQFRKLNTIFKVGTIS